MTGATDLALNLTQGGARVVQVMGVPDQATLERIQADVIVTALKTRAIRRAEAIEQSLTSAKTLQARGVERLFFKYCSTFDSTSEGNIGPVAEALMDLAGTSYTIFCPAFPRNGRTVYQGHLFVNGRLLSESGMRDHPLNPMTDPDLLRVLGGQSTQNVGLLPYESLRSGADSIAAELRAMCDAGQALIVTDACDDAHLVTLAEAVVELPLLTGGSGIARYLPDAYRAIGLLETPPKAPTKPTVTGRSLILSGSCSRATLRQVAWMEQRCPTWRLDVDKMMADPEASNNAVSAWAAGAPESQPLLVYSSAPPEQVARWQERYGTTGVATAIERFLADFAVHAVQHLGVRRLVLAGGETSGAVTTALGVTALNIGPEICPGVPWTESIAGPQLALALKSGNFGDEQFFAQALEMLD